MKVINKIDISFIDKITMIGIKIQTFYQLIHVICACLSDDNVLYYNVTSLELNLNYSTEIV